MTDSPREPVLLNQKLHNVVADVYQSMVTALVSDTPDVGSEEFISRFPFMFFHDDPAVCKRIVDAALGESFRQEAEKAVRAYYSDHGGGDTEYYMCDAVNDLLNYAIPRTIGLPDASSRFDQIYQQFDRAFFGPTFLVTTFSVVDNFWNTSTSLDLPKGFSLKSWTLVGIPANVAYLRDQLVPFIELRKSAHPIGHGRDITKQAGFQVFEHSTFLPKNDDAVPQAYKLRDEVARKFVFCVRLVNHSATFSDYRGFKMPGHLSAYSFNCMNFPDDRLANVGHTEFHDAAGMWFSKLFPVVFNRSYDRVSLFDRKLEDAMRRERRAFIDERQARVNSEIDQFLDYFQMLESVIPAAGSEYIALYAAVLLKASGFEGSQFKVYETFRFLKDMYSIRNAIMHGRVDEVIAGKTKTHYKLDIHRFRVLVHVLVSLYILNDGSLREPATRMALGESLQMDTLYKVEPDYWEKRRRTKAPAFPAW